MRRIKDEYLILESPHKRGVLTLRFEDDQVFFNHTLIHEKDEYEAFDANDYGIEMLNNHKAYHINGHIITYDEYRFIHGALSD